MGVSGTRAWLLYALTVFAQYAHADFTGKVVGVTDGDTITVLRGGGGTTVKVRLAEIDAPEKAQAFGAKAKQSLAELAYGRSVLVIEQGEDKYRRTLGRIHIDGLDINAEQVRRGMAWVYRRYSKDAALLQMEEEAKASRRGLWVDDDPQPPWGWRRISAPAPQ